VLIDQGLIVPGMSLSGVEATELCFDGNLGNSIPRDCLHSRVAACRIGDGSHPLDGTRNESMAFKYD